MPTGLRALRPIGICSGAEANRCFLPSWGAASAGPDTATPPGVLVHFCQEMLGLNNFLPTNGFSVLNHQKLETFSRGTESSEIRLLRSSLPLFGDMPSSQWVRLFLVPFSAWLNFFFLKQDAAKRFGYDHRSIRGFQYQAMLFVLSSGPWPTRLGKIGFVFS